MAPQPTQVCWPVQEIGETIMPYMATSDPTPDGTPPQIKVTVETVEELAAAMVATPVLTVARVVDDDHPEYGEGVQTRRHRGRTLELVDKQLYLGGRPLNEDEERELHGHTKTLTKAVDKYGLQLRGVI
jgi:hypothetical protein